MSEDLDDPWSQRFGPEPHQAIDAIRRAAFLAGEAVLLRHDATSAEIVAVGTGRTVARGDERGLWVRLAEQAALREASRFEYDCAAPIPSEIEGDPGAVELLVPLESLGYEPLERKGLLLVMRAVRFGNMIDEGNGQAGIEELSLAVIDAPDRHADLADLFGLPRQPAEILGLEESDARTLIDTTWAALTSLAELARHEVILGGDAESYPVRSQLGPHLVSLEEITSGLHEIAVRAARDVLGAVDPTLEIRTVRASDFDEIVSGRSPNP